MPSLARPYSFIGPSLIHERAFSLLMYRFKMPPISGAFTQSSYNAVLVLRGRWDQSRCSAAE
ncbi:hypothetical protein FAGKG844_880006 [Frankia sp. AgKG'84/4]